MADVLECLEEHAGIARVLDVQITRLNDVIEERLQLSVAKVRRGPAQSLGAFLEELADIIGRDGDHLTQRESCFKSF